MQLIDIQPQLVLEVAVGLDPFEEICERHGLSDEQTALLKKDKNFKRRVSLAEQELKKDGLTFRMRAAHAAEDVFGVAYKEARLPSTSLQLKMQFVEMAAKMGDVLPKNNITASTGSGFSITINMGGNTGSRNEPAGNVIDATPMPEVPAIAAKGINVELALPADYEYAE